ncbi:hypothetical protein F5Y16DRAFT_355908 [Xylariaceae sp. FL0255]|nr:hypothetical protein F5Y16DRAFT_355908 [Xylariaceae sp. FL0255]
MLFRSFGRGCVFSLGSAIHMARLRKLIPSRRSSIREQSRPSAMSLVLVVLVVVKYQQQWGIVLVSALLVGRPDKISTRDDHGTWPILDWASHGSTSGRTVCHALPFSPSLLGNLFQVLFASQCMMVTPIITAIGCRRSIHACRRSKRGNQ